MDWTCIYNCTSQRIQPAFIIRICCLLICSLLSPYTIITEDCHPQIGTQFMEWDAISRRHMGHHIVIGPEQLQHYALLHVIKVLHVIIHYMKNCIILRENSILPIVISRQYQLQFVMDWVLDCKRHFSMHYEGRSNLFHIQCFSACMIFG